MGDTVRIVESRPMSKTKRWVLAEVVEKSTEVDLAAIKAASAMEQGGESNALGLG
jgi:small subunit ribosomal protein S17